MDKPSREKYRVVIGLEVHAQLLTNSKVFVSDSTEYGNLPNTNLSVITLAHPGTLPVLNKKTVEYAIKMGLACHSDITRYNIFDRKNYFYPDLPKGYQITQDKTPICTGGSVPITLKSGLEKNIKLTRIHMEEDAGKSMHLDGEEDTLVDFNRTSVPLIEIVTEPVLSSSEEAYQFLTEVRRLVRYLEICDGNMEEGSLRCDANISIMKKDDTNFGKKVEVKNMNSFRNVVRAIEYEVDRQITEVKKGNPISSETRTYDASTGKTFGLRTKEEMNDYRYFPEPDLSPFVVTESWLEEIKSTMPSLPHELYSKFTIEYNLPDYDASVLTDSKEIALYFDELCSKTTNYKAASNWVMGPVKSYLNELTLNIKDFPLTTEKLAELIALVESNKVSNSNAAQNIFPRLIENPDKKPIEIAEELNLVQESDMDSIRPLITEVLESYPEKVEQYKKGKKGLLGLFMGEVMKKSKGKADPKIANQLLKESLEV
ncbi:MAG TPA: Asp-tRNA(Asn)/Glu-tRNA(Gln) amidotransferase subunit GatB [Cyclobacteriaceae bacterium]